MSIESYKDVQHTAGIYVPSAQNLTLFDLCGGGGCATVDIYGEVPT